MTSIKFAQWVQEQRIKKNLTIKQFEKEFNSFKASKKKLPSIGSRSYQWFTGFEKYGEFGKRELEMLNTMAQFFGYRIALLPDKDINTLSDKEKQEIQQFIKIEKQQEQKEEEHFTQKSITDKNW